MAITAAMVKELRGKTGAGMMDCKKALVETDGDIEAAIDWLRKKGLGAAEKKSGRTAADGLVGAAVSGGVGALAEINSETDFVARNKDFQSMVGETTAAALGVDDLAALAGAMLPSGKTVADTITDRIATIGENMNLRRMAKLSGDVVASYVHNAAAPGMGKIGVLVSLKSTGDAAALAAFGKQIAMHVAATNPAALSEADIDPALAEREKQVLTDQARESGKPEEVIKKMIEGRMRKYFQEVCLMKQAFVINPDLTVEKAVAEAAGGVGGPIEIVGFVRFEVGEGIDTGPEADFGGEVASMIGKD